MMEKQKMLPNYWESVILAVEELSKNSEMKEAIYRIVFDELKNYGNLGETLSPQQEVIMSLKTVKNEVTEDQAKELSMNIVNKIRFELGEEIKIQKKIGDTDPGISIKSSMGNPDDIVPNSSSSLKQ